MNINTKLEELFNLLDMEENIVKIAELKKKITQEEINLIQNYRLNPTIENKTKLYNNKIIKEYLSLENNINYLILEINKRFKRSHHACN